MISLSGYSKKEEDENISRQNQYSHFGFSENNSRLIDCSNTHTHTYVRPNDENWMARRKTTKCGHQLCDLVLTLFSSICLAHRIYLRWSSSISRVHVQYSRSRQWELIALVADIICSHPISHAHTYTFSAMTRIVSAKIFYYRPRESERLISRMLIRFVVTICHADLPQLPMPRYYLQHLRIHTGERGREEEERFIDYYYYYNHGGGPSSQHILEW